MFFKHPVYIVTSSAVGGHEEMASPHASHFDFFHESDTFGEDTFEKAESELSRIAFNFLLNKAGKSPQEIDLVISGDLQNQCVASSYGLYTFGIPYLPLYGACSTCTEGLLVGSLYLQGTDRSRPHYVGVVTTSHNSVAERQFRTPLEYGAERTPTAQWTATAGGAFLLTETTDGCFPPCECPYPVRIVWGRAGKVIDGAISDASNMGAAMAPAARESIRHFFESTHFSVEDLDAVITGDLGEIGSALLLDLLCEDGVDIRKIHHDCGMCLYDKTVQDVHAGASGCGCSASLLSAMVLPKMHRGEWKRVLFLSTGALMSPSSILQGISIFGIAPAVLLETEEKNLFGRV